MSEARNTIACKVLSPLRLGGKLRPVGAAVEVAGSEVENLVRLAAVKIVKDKTAPAVRADLLQALTPQATDADALEALRKKPVTAIKALTGIKARRAEIDAALDHLAKTLKEG